MADRDALIDRIRTLLAIADGGSPYPEERARARERAEKLMVRLAIDEAGIRMTTDAAQAPTARTLHFDAPYILDQQQLAFRISSVFGCSGVRYPSGRLVLVGFASDLSMAAALVDTLVPAMRVEMAAAGGSVSHRKSFAMAFASTVQARLRDFYAGALREAESDGTGSALVIARRSDEVEASFRLMFPHVQPARARPIASLDGWLAGDAAGRRADLSLGRKVGAARAGALEA